jgi:hypothetical protein
MRYIAHLEGTLQFNSIATFQSIAHATTLQMNISRYRCRYRYVRLKFELEFDEFYEQIEV